MKNTWTVMNNFLFLNFFRLGVGVNTIVCIILRLNLWPERNINLSSKVLKEKKQNWNRATWNINEASMNCEISTVHFWYMGSKILLSSKQSQIKSIIWQRAIIVIKYLVAGILWHITEQITGILLLNSKNISKYFI